MAETQEDLFYVVAQDTADPDAGLSAAEFADRSAADGETPPAVAAEVRRQVEIYPMPDGDAEGIEWVEGPLSALVTRPEMPALAEELMLADQAGALFRASRVEPLPPAPQGRLEMVHRPPGGAPVLDIVLLSEGYAAADRDSFFEAARRLCRGFLEIEPYKSHQGGLRIAALHLPSPESGITELRCDAQGRGQHDGAACRATGQRRSTLFGTSNMGQTYCRLISGSETRVRDVLAVDHVRALLTAQGMQPGLAIVVLNTRLYGGAGAAVMNISPLVVWTTPNERGPAVMAHETGHALGLQDEYEDAGTALPRPELWINISNEDDPAKTPWHCLATDHSGDYPSCAHHAWNCSCAAETVGTFEGAGYQRNGRYRPMKNCGMRTIGLPFCLVCSRQIANRLSGVAGRICP